MLAAVFYYFRVVAVLVLITWGSRLSDLNVTIKRAMDGLCNVIHLLVEISTKRAELMGIFCRFALRIYDYKLNDDSLSRFSLLVYEPTLQQNECIAVEVVWFGFGFFFNLRLKIV
jgi:hypothetical protein